MRGPEVTISLSCSRCEHCFANSDHSLHIDVYCIYPNAYDMATGPRKVIGNANWNTPQWCPLRKEAIDKAIAQIPPQVYG